MTPGDLGPAIVICLAFLIGGCSSAQSSTSVATPAVSIGASHPGSPQGAVGGAVDPQVMSDLETATFFVPNEMRRSGQVRSRILWTIYSACGGKDTIDIQQTDERFDQARYADAELIRSRGLVIDEKAPNGVPTTPPECQSAKVPSYRDWFNLGGEWTDTTRAADSADDVVAVKAGVAECMRRPTGFSVSTQDPTASYLVAFDGWRASHNDATRQRELGEVFLRCSEPYFSALSRHLNDARATALERHRELIEKMAKELVAIGYVPA
jgi:hypothetical protein